MTLEFGAVVIVAALLGLIFGSFVTALTYRLPRGESISHGRSRCPACAHVLTVRDLVPLFSWLANRGRCRHCHTPVSRRYPVIEALSFACFVVTALTVRDSKALGLALACIPILLSLAVIDYEHQKVPNVLLAFLVPLAVGWRWHTDGQLIFGLLAAGVTLAFLVGLGRLFRAQTGEAGIGMGDAKFIALGALAFAPLVFFGLLAVASVLGIVLAVWWRRNTGRELFPFAVTISLSWWVCLIFVVSAKHLGLEMAA